LLKFGEFEPKTSVLYPCPNKEFGLPAKSESIDAIRNQLAIGGRKVILSIARMVDGKGFPHLVTVIKKVADIVPNIAWLIIGSGPKLTEIINLVQKNSLQNIVRFIGEVPHEKLPAYFQASTVFTLLTHPDNGMEEGLGLVFLEAAASGLPCIAGKSGGVEEAIIHGQTGLVFDVYREQNAIVDGLIRIISDDAFAKQMGDAAQMRILSEFNWENQLKKMEPWIS
jgi:phosphatidylinositol alpha-1,6-mannosyltransferase